MKLVHFGSIAIAILLCGLSAGGAHAATLQSTQAPAGTPSSKPKASVQSRVQKVANPLNDLLEEAQHDIDKSNFEAAIAPPQNCSCRYRAEPLRADHSVDSTRAI